MKREGPKYGAFPQATLLCTSPYTKAENSVILASCKDYRAGSTHREIFLGMSAVYIEVSLRIPSAALGFTSKPQMFV